MFPMCHRPWPPHIYKRVDLAFFSFNQHCQSRTELLGLMVVLAINLVHSPHWHKHTPQGLDNGSEKINQYLVWADRRYPASGCRGGLHRVVGGLARGVCPHGPIGVGVGRIFSQRFVVLDLTKVHVVVYDPASPAWPYRLYTGTAPRFQGIGNLGLDPRMGLEGWRGVGVCWDTPIIYYSVRVGGQPPPPSTLKNGGALEAFYMVFGMIL